MQKDPVDTTLAREENEIERCSNRCQKVCILQHLSEGDLGLISGTDKFAAIFRERHQILRLKEHNEASCRTHFCDVLMLLQIGYQAQTYTDAQPNAIRIRHTVHYAYQTSKIVAITNYVKCT